MFTLVGHAIRSQLLIALISSNLFILMFAKLVPRQALP